MKSGNFHGCDDKEELLVDYIEGELDEVTHRAVEVLIKHSELDRQIVMNLQKTRETVRLLLEDEAPDQEAYHQRLTDKILSATDERSSQADSRSTV